MAIRLSAVNSEYFTAPGGLGAANFTIAYWAYFVSLADYNCQAHCNEASALACVLEGTPKKLGFYNGNLYQGSTTIETAKWYHVAFVYQNPGNSLIVLDGNQDYSGSFLFNGSNLDINFGRWGSGSDYSDMRWFGLKLWTAALSLNEIQAEMYHIRPVRFANLYGWYPMLFGSSERVRDYSGNGRGLTEYNTPTDEDSPPISWGGRQVLFVVPEQTQSDKTVTDAGTGTDDLASLTADVPLTDTGSGTDSPSVSTGDVSKSVTDAGMGGDNLAVEASTGEKFPTSATTAAESPWLDNNWTTPTNIYSDNGATANITATSYDSPDQSYVLKGYGFDFSGIPANSVILGVIVRINAWYRSGQGSGSIDLVQLLNTSLAKVGDNKAATPVALNTTDTTVYTFGGSSDLWGNVLTLDWIQNSNFGVALGIAATAANADVDIDYVTIEVFYRPPSTANVTDSGAGSDAVLSITASVPIDDTGSGTDEITSIAASVSITDAGTGTDAVTVEQPPIPIDLSDTGSGTETIGVTVPVDITDTGAGVDDVTSITASVPVTDTGTGADDLTGIAADVQATDAGSGADSLTGITADVQATDTGTGADTPTVDISGSSVLITDTGAGVDDVTSITASVPVTDTGTGAESIAITVPVDITDAGTGTDTPTVEVGVVPVNISDAGSGVDSVSIAAAFTLADTGAGTDTIAGLEIAAAVSDNGAGVDGTPQITAAVQVGESGSGVDTPSITVVLTISDTGSGVDLVSVSSEMEKLITDIGTGSDAVTGITAETVISDSGTGLENATITAILDLTDAAAGSDVIANILAAIQLSDIAAGSEVVSAIDSSKKLIEIVIALSKRSVSFTMASREVEFTMASREVGFSLAQRQIGFSGFSSRTINLELAT